MFQYLFAWVSEAQFHSTQRRVETQFARYVYRWFYRTKEFAVICCNYVLLWMAFSAQYNSFLKGFMIFRDFKRFFQLQIYISICGQWQGLADITVSLSLTHLIWPFSLRAGHHAYPDQHRRHFTVWPAESDFIHISLIGTANLNSISRWLSSPTSNCLFVGICIF